MSRSLSRPLGMRSSILPRRRLLRRSPGKLTPPDRSSLGALPSFPPSSGQRSPQPSSSGWRPAPAPCGAPTTARRSGPPSWPSGPTATTRHAARPSPRIPLRCIPLQAVSRQRRPQAPAHTPHARGDSQVLSAFRTALGAGAEASPHLLGDVQDAAAALLAVCTAYCSHKERSWIDRKLADLALAVGASSGAVGWGPLPVPVALAIARRLKVLDRLGDVVELLSSAFCRVSCYVFSRRLWPFPGWVLKRSALLFWWGTVT